MQKVHLLRLMRVYVDLIMLAAIFVIPANKITSTYNCALIKVDWLAACFALRVLGAVCFDLVPPALA